MIVISTQVEPDLVIRERITNSWNDDVSFNSIQFSFEHMVATVMECNSEGEPKYSYEEYKFIACRLINDDVYIVDTSFGWKKHELASAAWHDKIAERELLDESTN